MGKSPLRAHFLGLRAHCAETLRAFPVGAERRPATRAIHYGFFRVCSCGGEPRARATTPVRMFVNPSAGRAQAASRGAGNATL